MTITEATNLIITSETINATTIKSIVSGMYAKVISFNQDGDCGWVKVQDFDGSRAWMYVATAEAAKLIVGYTL
jgi:hypothetical protein